MNWVHFQRVAVTGSSMAPAYFEGDWLLIRQIRIALPKNPRGISKLQKLVGKVVLIQRSSEIGSDFIQIKRINKVEVVEKKIQVWVLGDNKIYSTDSRTWGPLRKNEVLGVVLFRYKRG